MDLLARYRIENTALERRSLEDRIAYTLDQIDRIARNRALQGKYSERAMHYGLQNLHSHVATLRWRLAVV